MIDEKYFQKFAHCESGEYIGVNEAGNLFKGIVAFMAIGLKKGGRGKSGGSVQRGCQPSQSSLLRCPFLPMSPLNVLFLKEATKNVHENQQAKSRAS